MSAPWILVVAGHDPSGGAGVTADVEAASELGVEARCVVTAWTDQDACAVRAVGERPAQEWLAEALERARERPAALKLGLLPSAASVRAAAELVRAARAEQPVLPVVLDPVIAASSGFRFLDEHAVAALRTDLLALGPIVTPNLAEAAELAGAEVAELAPTARSRAAAAGEGTAATAGDAARAPGAARAPSVASATGAGRDASRARVEAARRILDAGARAVVLTGGHGEGELVRDLVLARDGPIAWIEHPRRAGARTRGTGCRHASALAAGLAGGRSLLAAAHDAALLVARRIAG